MTSPADEGAAACDGGPDLAAARDPLLTASWAGSIVFALTAGAAAAVPEADIVALVVALLLFAGGTVAFAAALVRAAARSRNDELTMAGLFFLEGAPAGVRRQFVVWLAVEIVVAFVTAGLRPNSSLAFGILAPVWGVGLAALWAARQGTFPPRRPPVRPGAPPGTAAKGPSATQADDPPAGRPAS